VADDGAIHPNRNIANIVIRKQLQPTAGQYIDLATLKKPVKTASTAVDTVPDAIVKQTLNKAGFKDADVKYQYLGLPDINLGLKNGNIDPNGNVSIAALQPLVDSWIQTKALQVPTFDVKTLVDASFAQAAAQSLGAYRH